MTSINNEMTGLTKNRYQKGFEPLMPGFVYVDYNDAKGTRYCRLID